MTKEGGDGRLTRKAVTDRTIRIVGDIDDFVNGDVGEGQHILSLIYILKSGSCQNIVILVSNLNTLHLLKLVN